MVEFSKAEERFLRRNELGRLATVSRDGMPHVVPVCYLYHAGDLLIAIDYETKKYRNLRADDRAAFVVDVYKPTIRGILVQGKAEILERGSVFQEAYGLFHRRFSWVRRDPWKEGEAPFVRLKPSMKTSWNLAQ
jgi:PPOX class F420-dependent enzyme/OxyR family protein